MRTMLAAAVALVATAAIAAPGTPGAAGVSVRAGLFLPTNADARNEGASFIALGAEYKLRELNFIAAPGYSADLTLSLDYFGKGDYRNVPLLVNYVGHVSNIFYSAGVGAGFSRRPLGNSSEAKTLFTYQVGAGYEFPSSTTPFFLEAKFFGTERPELWGTGIYAGVRF